MVYIRILLLFFLIAVGLVLCAYVMTNDRRYLVRALNLLKGALVCALVFFGLLFLERMALAPGVSL
jgi:hypothetical protein